MRGLICLLLVSVAAPVAAHDLPPCYDPETSELREVYGDELKNHGGHDLGPLVYAYGTKHDIASFRVSYVIDTSGHVSCMISAPDYPPPPPFEMTPERQALLDSVAAMTFTPFQADGQPVSVRVEAYVNEEERPQYHVQPPAGDLASATIQIETNGHRSGFGTFKMTFKGDGTAIFIPKRGDMAYWLGPQTYHIPQAQVAGMLDMANKADFWSLRDVYWPEKTDFWHDTFTMGPDAYYKRIIITLGGRTKSLTMYDWAGFTAPTAVRALMDDMAHMGNIGLWRGFSGDTVNQLSQNGFDFTSKKGGDLLIHMTARSSVPDTVIYDLIGKGAPQDIILSGFYTLDTSLFDAAVVGGREEMVNNLIKQGTLLTAEKPDPVKITRALAHAVESLSPAMVSKLMAYHPALVYRQKSQWHGKTHEEVYPIITLVPVNHWYGLPGDISILPDQIAVTQQLLDAGADINSRDLSDHSLLDNAVQIGDVRFAKWLAAHGALINEAKLDLEDDENFLVAMLDAGYIPTPALLTRMRQFAERNNQGKIATWLKSHAQ